MLLRITRLRDDIPMPKYETPGACAFDVHASERTVVAPRSLGFVPTGLVVAVPDGHVLLLASRSSTPRKKGLLTPHGMGVIDTDYCGPADELKVQVWNFSDAECVVEAGERIAQCLVMPQMRCELVEGAPVSAVSRGGFGTTG